MAGNQTPDSEHGVALKTRVRSKIKRPRMYRVILHNDDFSPMDFVVRLLQIVFRKSESEATLVMLQIHTRGSGVAGLYTHEIAETKVAQVHMLARQAEFPLMASLEPESEENDDNDDGGNHAES
jgi:ATP-dependent Clp protease adaptor protein ClpS